MVTGMPLAMRWWPGVATCDRAVLDLAFCRVDALRDTCGVGVLSRYGMLFLFPVLRVSVVVAVLPSVTDSTW